MSASLAHTTSSTNQARTVRPQAAVVNASFKNQASHYVTLQDRLNHYMKIPDYATAIKQAQTHWRARYPAIRNWDQIVLGKAQDVPLSEIQIDTTLQREVVISWLCTIIQEFKDLRVMPINVYKDQNQPNPHMFTCWDGQHTALSLWVICTQILKLDPSQCMVPLFIHTSTNREQMRENFTELNGPAKREVSKAELFRQEVLGVRVDGSQRPTWRESELKQCILEKHQLFVCDETNNLAHQPGAITNMSEILATGKQGAGKRYQMQELELFCALMNEMGLNRAVQSMEMWQWMDYLRACRVSGISVDMNYLQTVAQCVHTCFQSFDSKLIHDKGKLAYLEWFRDDRPFANGLANGHTWRDPNRKELHLAWISSVISKWTQLATPQVYSTWYPDDKWLDLGYLRQ